MTIHRNLNKVGVGGNYTAYWILKTLQDAGWTCERSGSGTNGVFDTADVFSDVVKGSLIVYPGDAHPPPANVGLGSGLETMGGPWCWFVLRCPGGNREIILIRGPTKGDASDDEWFMGYSPGSQYIGGGPDVPATAIDEEQVSTGGNRAAPGTVYVNGNVANLIHVAADDTPSPDGEYGFLCLEMITVNDVNSITGIDDRRNNAIGDTESLILIQESTDLTVALMFAGSFGYTICDPLGVYAWLPMTVVFPCTTAGGYQLTGRISEIDSFEHPLPLYYLEHTTYGYRGSSRWFYSAAVARDYPNTGNAETLLYVDDILIVDLLDGLTTPAAI